MKRSARFRVALLVSSLIAVGQARADFMNWSYSTSTVPPGFSANGAGGPASGGGTIQLTPYNNASSGPTINAIAYTTSAATPVSFNNAAYTLTMTITDNTTHDSGNLTFSGSISGGLNPTSSTLVNTFANPTESLTLDGHKYTVTLPSSMTLASPLSSQQNIAATVSVSNAPTTPPTNTPMTPLAITHANVIAAPAAPVHGAPEPASLLLGGLGVCLTGLGGWWKRQRPAT